MLTVEKVIVNDSLMTHYILTSQNKLSFHVKCHHIYDISNVKICKTHRSIRSAAKYDVSKEKLLRN